MSNGGRDNAGVVAPPPLIYLLPLPVGLLLNRRVKAGFRPNGATRLVGLPLVVRRALFGDLVSVHVARRGHAGTPPRARTHPRHGRAVRYGRNPGYLSMAMMYAGVSSVANSLPSILLLPVALGMIRRGVIDREECYLARLFGNEYLSYKARVRRWV